MHALILKVELMSAFQKHTRQVKHRCLLKKWSVIRKDCDRRNKCGINNSNMLTKKCTEKWDQIHRGREFYTWMGVIIVGKGLWGMKKMWIWTKRFTYTLKYMRLERMLYVRCTGEAVQWRGHLLLGEEMEVQSVTVDFEKPRKSFVI